MLMVAVNTSPYELRYQEPEPSVEALRSIAPLKLKYLPNGITDLRQAAQRNFRIDMVWTVRHTWELVVLRCSMQTQ